jgi:hypothetical protein
LRSNPPEEKSRARSIFRTRWSLREAGLLRSRPAAHGLPSPNFAPESRLAAYLDGFYSNPNNGHSPEHGAAPAAMVRLFDGHRLGEIARLADISSQDKRGVVREKL